MRWQTLISYDGVGFNRSKSRHTCSSKPVRYVYLELLRNVDRSLAMTFDHHRSLTLSLKAELSPNSPVAQYQTDVETLVPISGVSPSDCKNIYAKATTRIQHAAETHTVESQNCLSRLEEYNRAPIFQLPSELLGEIFVLCLPEDRHPEPKEAPLLLCHVCSSWRSVALGHPVLWDTLLLSFSGGLSTRLRRSAANIMNLWFKGAANSIIFFSLKYGSDDGFLDIHRAIAYRDNPMEDAIIQHSHHFHTLILDIPMRSDFSSFLSLPSGCVDQLEHFVLKVDVAYTGEQPTTVFESAPRLRRVDMPVNDFDAMPFDVSFPTRSLNELPWAQLTHLQLRSSLPFRLWRMLFVQCLALQECTFTIDCRGVGYDSTIIDADGPATFVHLENLTVDTMYTESQDSFRFLTHGLFFPALTALEVRNVSIDSFWIQGLSQFTPAQFFHSLSLQAATVSSHNLKVLVRGTPRLKALSITIDNSYSLDDEVIVDCLTLHQAKSEILLPNLEVLDVLIFTSRHTPYAQLLSEMIMSRRRAHGSTHDIAYLRRVKLGFDDDFIAEEVRAALEPLQVEGLEVEISSFFNPSGPRF